MNALIKAKASLNVLDSNNYTALAYGMNLNCFFLFKLYLIDSYFIRQAVTNNRLDISNLLLMNNASADVLLTNGQTLLIKCTQNKNSNKIKIN